MKERERDENEMYAILNVVMRINRMKNERNITRKNAQRTSCSQILPRTGKNTRTKNTKEREDESSSHAKSHAHIRLWCLWIYARKNENAWGKRHACAHEHMRARAQRRSICFVVGVEKNDMYKKKKTYERERDEREGVQRESFIEC